MRKRAVFGVVSIALVACSQLLACSGDEAATPPAEDGGAPDVTVPEAAPPVVDAGVDAGPPLDIPDSLLKALGAKPYVEETCQSTTYPGWPYEAQKCTYHKGLVVTVADPTAERVARWIVEASRLIPALDALHTRDRTNWEAGLVQIAKHTMTQSSRIFPLQGQIDEGTVYTFERGVTSTCKSGCYCRVNSTSREQWCRYAANALKTETESACLTKYGIVTESDGGVVKSLTEDWLAHCMANHVASWNSDGNEHYRAQAWNANQDLAAKFPDPNTADGAAVVKALETEYPIF